jgi:glyoxylase-like metal-dependent hydrolase (beta-lactamase superfamily II)
MTTPIEIAEGVYFLPIGPISCNVYFARTPASWLLVDAALTGRAGRIRHAAESLFGTQAPEAIVLTHMHPDHAGSARELAQGWSCPVLVPEREMELALPHDLSTVERFANPIEPR